MISFLEKNSPETYTTALLFCCTLTRILDTGENTGSSPQLQWQYQAMSGGSCLPTPDPQPLTLSTQLLTPAPSLLTLPPLSLANSTLLVPLLHPAADRSIPLLSFSVHSSLTNGPNPTKTFV